MYSNGVSNHVASYHRNDADSNYFSENRARNERESQAVLQPRMIFIDDDRIANSSDVRNQRNAILLRQTETKTSNADAYASFSSRNGLPNAAEFEFSRRTKFAPLHAQQSTISATKNASPATKTTATTQHTHVNNVGKYF